MLKITIRNSVVVTLRVLTPIFGRNNHPTTQAVRAMVNKFIDIFILNVLVNISADMYERVIENWIQRIDRCRRARGGHINDVEFHT